MSSAAILHHVGHAFGKVVTAIALVFIGLFVGIGCVLLPPAIPLGIVGLAALLLLWVMPDLRVTPQAFTRMMIWPYFISTVCVPVYYAVILPGIPWISIRRACLFGLVIPFCLLLASSASSRHLVVNRLRSAPLLFACLLGIGFMMVLSTIMSIRPFVSLSDIINITLTWFIPMLAVILIADKERFAVTLFRVAIYCASINVVLGFIEFIYKKPFLINLLPSYMREQIVAQNPLAIVGVTGQVLRGGMYRAAATFTISLSWGEFSAMVAPFALHFIAHGRSLGTRLFGTLGLVVCFASIVLSGSRGAYVALIAAIVCYTSIWAFRQCRLHPGRLTGQIWLIVYSMASVAGIGAVFFVGAIRKRVLGAGETQGSTDARFMEWAMAKPKILESPLWGYGSAQASDVIHFVNEGSLAPTVDGYYMNLLVDYGIPGLLFYIVLFGGAALICLWLYMKSETEDAAWGAAVGTSIVAFFVYRVTLSQLDNNGFAFILIALTVVYVSEFARKGNARSVISDLHSAVHA